MKFLPSFFNKVREKTLRSVRRAFGMSGGSYVNEDSAMQVSAFYRGLIYISTQVAKLPWEIKDKDNNKIHNAVYYLLNVAPNDEMTSFNLKLFLVQCAIMHGQGYAEIERYIDGRPKALWPLNPKKVTAIRDRDGKLWYQVTTDGESDVYLRPKDIFIVRNFHSLDSIQSHGVIGYAIDVLGISLGADKFANSLFANGGMPSGVLKYTGTLSDEAYERLKETWSASHGGRKTGQTAILEDGIEYSPISHSPDVLQFLESRKFNISEIARFLGVPPTKLFDTDASKFNNIEHANLEVVTDTLDSWCRTLESEADVKLLNNQYGGYRTEFDLYAVFRGDMDTRSQYFSRMMQAGAITPNEIRMKEGLAPYKGGDRFFIAVNNFTPADRLDEVIDAQVAPKQIEAPKETEKSKEDEELEKAAKAKIAAILNQPKH